jgi:DNA-directed RNA polymerase II subunit RPB2
MCHVTIPCSSEALTACTLPHVIPPGEATAEERAEGTRVFINGAWVGMAKDACELYKDLKDKKCRGVLNIYTSIAFCPVSRELRCCTAAGRVTRPLIRVVKGKPLLTHEHVRLLEAGELKWDDLLTDARGHGPAPLEYIDASEQATSMIAMNVSDLAEAASARYTHCEIHPSIILGILASCIPFPEGQ